MIHIATCVLQGKRTNLLSAMQIVKECINDTFENLETLSKMDYGTDNSEKRQATRLPERLRDSIIDVHLQSEQERAPGDLKLTQTVTEVCDTLTEELSRRFANENVSVWIAMEPLSPLSKEFLNPAALKPLFGYAKSVPTLNNLWIQNDVRISFRQNAAYSRAN